MIPSDHRTRRRPIKACIECYRRKQRCDRGRPCNVCTSRKVPERCIYTEFHPSSHSDSPTDGLQVDSSDSQSFRLNDEAGYSRLVYPSGSMNDSILSTSRRPTNVNGAMETAYLDIIAQFPPAAIVQELVEIYFKEADWFFGLLERYYFDRWMVYWQAAKSSFDQGGSITAAKEEVLHFPALLFQLLAVALHFLPPNASCINTLQVWHTSARDKLSNRYSDHAMRIMSTLGQGSPTLPSVQQGQLRALWLKNSSRGKEAWFAVGDTIRLAQDLNLHLEPDPSEDAESPASERLSRLWRHEFRRRIWSKLFAWDSHMSISLGRPRAINLQDCSARAPTDVDFPNDPSSTPLVTPGPRDPPSSYTPHLVQHIMGEKIHEAMSAGIHKPGTPDYNAVMACHQQVSTLLENLHPAMNPFHPNKCWDASVPHMQEKRLQTTVNTSSFLLALHRLHVRDQSFSRAAAINAALMILTAQQKLYELFLNLDYKIFMLSYYTVDCSLFLAATRMAIVNWEPQLAQQVDDALKQSVQRLSWMARRSKLAETGLQALKKNMEKLRQEVPGASVSIGDPMLPLDGVPTVMGSASSSNVSIDDLNDPMVGTQRGILYSQQEAMLFPPATEADAMMFTDQPQFDLEALMAVTDPDYTLENFLSQNSGQ